MLRPNRHIRTLLYTMKRRMGAAIDIYRRDTSTTDRDTGLATETKSVLHVKRAIVLDSRNFTEFQFDLAYILTSRNFSMGATYDAATRGIIIDPEDVSADFTINRATMWVGYGGRRWEIVEVLEYEVERGLTLKVKETKSTQFTQIFDKSIHHHLTGLTQEVTHV